MNRRINLAIFFISLITALPGSNGDDTSTSTVTQNITFGIEEIIELARQMKENVDQEDEEIRTLSLCNFTTELNLCFHWPLDPCLNCLNKQQRI